MANVYGMTGGVSDPYTGSHNIRPTTTDIQLNTEGKILENDLTIQGGGQLYGSAIKYGLSIFGTAGTGVYVNFHGGIGTAFRNGVGGLGDVVNAISDSDKKYVRVIEYVNLIIDKYPYLPVSSNEKLIFRSSNNPNIYATLTVAKPNATVTFYNNLNKISAVTLTEVNAYASYGFHCATSLTEDAVYIAYASVSTTEDPTGYRIYIYRVQYNTSIAVHRTIYGSERPARLCVTDQYVICCGWDRSSSPGDIDIRVYNLDLSLAFTSSTTISDNIGGDLQNWIVSYGLDQRVYVLSPGIYQSQRNFNTVYCYIPTSAQLVFTKNLNWSDLSYASSVYAGSDDISALLLFCDGANGNIYLYYSNQPFGNTIYQDAHTALATFNFNMTSKISDILMNTAVNSALVNNENYSQDMLDANFYYDKDTKTILYWTYTQFARLGLDGTTYAWVTDGASSQVLVPCLLSDGSNQVDYCYESNALEDTSVTTAKTITTDTYTATIEEV